MLFAIEPEDSIDVPESLQGNRDVVVGDMTSVLGALGYDSLEKLSRDQPVLHTFAQRFASRTTVLAQKRIIVLDRKQAQLLALGLSSIAHQEGGPASEP